MGSYLERDLATRSGMNEVTTTVAATLTAAPWATDPVKLALEYFGPRWSVAYTGDVANLAPGSIIGANIGSNWVGLFPKAEVFVELVPGQFAEEEWRVIFPVPTAPEPPAGP